MLFERQRLLLTLLDAAGAAVSHTDFQELLFLYTREREATPSYEFVPYEFGGFSFTSYADKRKLIEVGLLANDDQVWRLTDAGRAAVRDRPTWPLQVAEFCRRHDGLRGNALIAEAYRRHPYYATHSGILDKLPLEPEALERIAAARPVCQPAGLLTIGYEGLSLEAYLNELLLAGVTRLFDVRRNPLSRKYGFSKGTLGKACDGVRIHYVHIPELGIASENRRGLETQADYDALFETYEKEQLPLCGDAVAEIARFVAAGERVALTCYERKPEQCHRHCVAEALEHRFGRTYAPQHL
jgi:hypothetical protein